MTHTTQMLVPRKIVLLEPNRHKRALHSLILLTHGYHTDATGDEAQADAICARLHPDLLLVGSVQPLSAIFEVYDRFRRRYPHCKIAFVPGEIELCDLFFNGECIRDTAATDFTGDVAKFLAQTASEAHA